MNAAVDIIMPVYNAEAFLRQAVQSILDQSFSQFRLIIVNDHSSDSSQKIIQSFNDPRIINICHEENRGVVAAMNTGLEKVTAPYVAVMHADDIAVPRRLEWQKQWLDQHQDAAVVAGFITFIDHQGNETGTWDLDRKKKSRRAIRRAMMRENCIAHPTVMMRTSIVKRYGYDPGQQLEGFAVEDYPLWLNLLSDGYWIDKIPETVLLYRTHPLSATSQFLRRRNPFLVNYFTKKAYLRQRRKNAKINGFDLLIGLSLRKDYFMAQLKRVKTYILKQFHVPAVSV